MFIKGKRYLGVIPARAGSKRIPGKNVKYLAGSPLLSYTIEACVNSTLLDDFVVSTEDEEIEDLAHSYGAPVLHRPKSLATDLSTSGEVAAHAIDAMNADEGHFHAAVLLHPTSPLRTGQHIDEAIEMFEGWHGDYLASVTLLPRKAHRNIGTLGRLTHSQEVSFGIPNGFRRPVIMNAAIYIIDAKRLSATKRHTNSFYAGYLMPKAVSIDIDDDHDWRIADMLVRHERQG